MSLLRLGEGDIVDRMTILTRKMVEAPDRRDFADEFAELQLRARFDLTKPLKLAALNAAIWQREDELRRLARVRGDAALEEGPEFMTAIAREIAAIALAIQSLNDRRAALIAELNGTPSEKLYR